MKMDLCNLIGQSQPCVGNSGHASVITDAWLAMHPVNTDAWLAMHPVNYVNGDFTLFLSDFGAHSIKQMMHRFISWVSRIVYTRYL